MGQYRPEKKNKSTFKFEEKKTLMTKYLDDKSITQKKTELFRQPAAAICI